MKITTSHNSQVAPGLSALIVDPGQHVAASPDIAAALGLAPCEPVALPGGLVLQALMEAPAAADATAVRARDVLDMTGHVTKIGALTLDFARSQLPGISPQLGGAIQGVQVALLGIAAAKAWSEVGEKGYTKAVLTTSSAALDLLKLVQDVVPGFEKLGPALAVVSFLVKVGDVVYQVKLDVEAMRDAPADAGLIRSDSA
ncbi:MAG: hypothetical protein Q8M09_17620 [Pseudomonadota bacterium]|nr:hypothetical protein [Pseudomonadota bacterium]MDP1906038.1 hypothetical protein [Pseudomonadota bacterium]MDP2352508.1 hypothetical protein [Pseudomonadota bacterium]